MIRMKMATPFYKHNFSDEISKQAYLKACKWLAENVVSKVEIGETFWKITKVEDASLPTFKLELYALIDTEDNIKAFCERCKEFHRVFYVNQQFNCNSCNLMAFKNQMDEKLKIKKSYRQERLKHALGDD